MCNTWSFPEHFLYMLSNEAVEQVQIHPAIQMQEEPALSSPFPVLSGRSRGLHMREETALD